MINIVLIGAPGSGKTSLAKALSDKLRLASFDTDELIVRQTGKSIPDIFSTFGEEHFRDLESQTLDTLISSPASIATAGCFILATGGGTPIRQGNFAKLQKIGEVVLLEANLDILVARVLKTQGSRPLLSASGNDEISTRNRLESLLAARNEIYRQAHHRIDTSRLSPEAAALQVIDVLKLDAE